MYILYHHIEFICHSVTITPEASLTSPSCFRETITQILTHEATLSASPTKIVVDIQQPYTNITHAAESSSAVPVMAFWAHLSMLLCNDMLWVFLSMLQIIQVKESIVCMSLFLIINTVFYTFTCRLYLIAYEFQFFSLFITAVCDKHWYWLYSYFSYVTDIWNYEYIFQMLLTYECHYVFLIA